MGFMIVCLSRKLLWRLDEAIQYKTLHIDTTGSRYFKFIWSLAIIMMREKRQQWCQTVTDKPPCGNDLRPEASEQKRTQKETSEGHIIMKQCSLLFYYFGDKVLLHSPGWTQTSDPPSSPVILVLRRLRQEDPEFKASLGIMARPSLKTKRNKHIQLCMCI
jgi:hypothetical protein